LDYGARFYDPVIGRWTTVDPSADEADQESFSPYSYVFNNPVKNTDPDGRIPNIDPPSAKTVIKGAAITTGGVAGGIFAASLATGGIVAAGGTATIVGAPVGWAVGAGIIVGGAATAGIMWLADKMTSNNSESSEPTGSYTNKHESGKKYHGKGGEKRAAESGKQKADKKGDPLVSTDWTPAANDREAFKDEDSRMNTDEGGHKSGDNYNQRASPGAKYKKQDEKPKPELPKPEIKPKHI
ncbi:RHS repeat-associated core domain-containing protein, partial [Pedobacter hiemivivus]|uniref:RHS repeat-associated core domain-containing protein n=1 Tax=Pedobacter hiemivivus TaxID=2530454 RepID=UPI00198253F5